MAEGVRFEVADRSPAAVAVDALVLPCAEGPRPGPGVAKVSEALGQDLTAVLRRRGFRGRGGEAVAVPTLGSLPARTLVFVGLGPAGQAGSSAVRDAAVAAARQVGGARTLATTLARAGEDVGAAAEAFAEGLELGGYRFERAGHDPVAPDDVPAFSVRRATLLVDRAAAAAARAGAARGRVLGRAANWARDMVNTPAGDATPEALAEEARAMAGAHGVRCRVWSPAGLSRGGFGGILGVGRGSASEPRMVELEYGEGRQSPLALTGKGITYDSGGLVLKRPAELEWMKSDMAGGAAVLGTIRAAAELELPVRLRAVVPFADNMPGGRAIRPGDVLTHRGGRTSEVVDTDCEGRLVLADTLAYLAESRPAAIVDAATLTDAGGLGDGLWAVLGTDPSLVSELLAAGRAAGDPGWELPLWEDYLDLLRSPVADIRNSPTEGPDSTVMAALYLRPFVGGVPWAHLDIGTTAWMERETGRWPKGATGSPVRVLTRWVAARAAARASD